jgi:hypothetical protein
VLKGNSQQPLRKPAPGVRLIRGLNRTKRNNDVTGGTAAIFTVRRPRRGYLG